MDTNWKTLKDKYICIKDREENVIRLGHNPLSINIKSKLFALVIDATDKKVKLKFGGKKLTSNYKILKDGGITEDIKLGFSSEYDYVRELTKSEILEFEVSNCMCGFYDKIESDFTAMLLNKTKKECKYMKKCADFELEKYIPIKKIANVLSGLVILSTGYIITLILLDNRPLNLCISLFIFFILKLHLSYIISFERYKNLILNLESKILSID